MRSRPKYKWFKPIIALAVTAIVYLAFGGIIYAIAYVFGVPLPGLGGHAAVPGQYLEANMTDPAQIALTALSIGVMIPAAPIAIILQGVVFGLSHGYDLATNIIIVINGILWGWLTAKTGGLEASICLHASNNVVVFMTNSVFVCTTVTVNNSIGCLPVDVVIVVVMAAFAHFPCKKNGFLLKR